MRSWVFKYWEKKVKIFEHKALPKERKGENITLNFVGELCHSSGAWQMNTSSENLIHNWI